MCMSAILLCLVCAHMQIDKTMYTQKYKHHRNTNNIYSHIRTDTLADIECTDADTHRYGHNCFHVYECLIWHNFKLFTCILKIEPPLPHPLRPCSFPCQLLICRPGPENHREVWEMENSPDQATMPCRAAPRCVCRARGPADSGPDHCCSCPNTGGGSECIQRCRTVDGRRSRQHTRKLPQ